ncbi:MAG: hypothetical protein JO057_11965 [Chloroflexi bacterium]|nr:hypothetical protein [Chloroflexota bacterium]
MTETILDDWVPVSTECFEYNLVPWIGPRHTAWLRASSLPHPVDPSGQVLIPPRVYELFKTERIPMVPITRQQLSAMGAR